MRLTTRTVAFHDYYHFSLSSTALTEVAALIKFSSSAAAVTLTGAGSVAPVVTLAGYLLKIPALLTVGPAYTSMAPITALALLFLAASVTAAARGRSRATTLCGYPALALATLSLISNLLDNTGWLVPVLAPWIHRDLQPLVMSYGTSLAISSTGLALWPSFRRRRFIPDLFCGFALVIAGTSVLGYLYGTLDLYGTSLFRTMSLRTAISIFILAIAASVVRAENGWFALLTAHDEPGAATRRQILLAMGAPIAGYIVLGAARHAHLGVAAALAIFVMITSASLIWLVLRDGRRLRELWATRRAQRDATLKHTQELEQQLARQAEQLERKNAASIALAQQNTIHSDNRYRILFESIKDAFCIVELKFDAEGVPVDYKFLETNRTFESITGLEQPQGKWMREMRPNHEQHWFDLYGKVALTRTVKRFEDQASELGNRWYEVNAFPVDAPELNRVGILFNDITERRLATEAMLQANLTLEQRVAAEVEERERAQEALRQSQKMDAVGQLTGGLAHDFNNLLQGILGSLELLNSRVTQGRFEELPRYVAAAQVAAKRASALTHRLLAFSRRQTLDPKPTDVNHLVASMEDLIRRTVGPHIAVENIAAGGLWVTRVDQSQLENSLLNLCINARDAMPSGGRLVIETGNKWLDARAAQERDLPPGQFITLCVSDDGCGMSPDVIARAFDPFFTTKPIGLGTGLGLSMIYGFAKQSGGQVRIYSEIGRGTMVCLWLPRYHGSAVREEIVGESAILPKIVHKQTVLIVDDEPTVRMLVHDVTDELGFAVLEAADGPAALQILQSEQRIDLLITDVGLPGGLNGRQVADAARETRPHLKILFITGYAENAVLSHGHLPAGMHVLTKPFAMETIASRIYDLTVEDKAG